MSYDWIKIFQLKRKLLNLNAELITGRQLYEVLKTESVRTLTEQAHFERWSAREVAIFSEYVATNEELEKISPNEKKYKKK